jgi:adenosylmethionine-8-amino-7-oxononanoate aminotransferase
MQTVLKIKVSDLDNDFVKAIKALFKHNSEIEITVSSANDFNLNKTETKQEYIDRLKKAIENAEKGNIIAFTEKEFEIVNKNLLGKR